MLCARFHHTSMFCYFLAFIIVFNELTLNSIATGGVERTHLNIKREEGRQIEVETVYGRLAGFSAFIPLGNGFADDAESSKTDETGKKLEAPLPVNVFLGIRYAKADRFEVLF